MKIITIIITITFVCNKINIDLTSPIEIIKNENNKNI